MKVNAYDFDRTIYDGDSTLDFYIYCLKKYPKIMVYLPRQLLGFLLYLLGMLERKQFKERFYVFLKNFSDVDSLTLGFWSENEKKIKPWYQTMKRNSDIIISASPEFLLAPICQRIGAESLIASKVDCRTGVYIGENCYGAEKVNRLKTEKPYVQIEAFYSDSFSDLPFVKLAEKSFLVKRNKVYVWEQYQPSFLDRAKTTFLTKEFIRFLIIGILNVINGVLSAIIYSIFIKANLAFIMGYITSLTISYMLNCSIVFKRSFSFMAYIRFCVSYIPNFLIQNVIVIIVYNYLGLNKVFAYFFAAVVGVPVTFLLLKFYAFNKD